MIKINKIKQNIDELIKERKSLQMIMTSNYDEKTNNQIQDIDKKINSLVNKLNIQLSQKEIDSSDCITQKNFIEFG